MSIDCPHFGPCSGCTLAQDASHPPIWSKIQEYLPRIEPLQVGALCGWRTKAKLAVRGTASHPVIGLFRSGSHLALEIPHCQVHHPAINRAVAFIVRAIQEEQIPPYDEKGGLLRYIQCLVDLKTEKIQLALVWNVPEETLVIKKFIEQLRKEDVWHSIWSNFQPQITNRIFGPTWQHCFGEPFLYQTLGPLEIPFHPASFSQAHWRLFERLSADVVRWVPEQARLTELYSGVGALGLLAAPTCTSVHLVENNPYAELCFRAMHAPKHVQFHCLDAEKAHPFLAMSDCVIVDPPRKGLGSTLLNALKEWAGSLIYVSCDFGSFRRDAELLQEAGWVVAESRGYLLFPGTDHVEVTALLTKNH